MEKNESLRSRIADALADAGKVFDPAGVMVTHFVLIAELMDSNGDYYLSTLTDGDAREWIHLGMLEYANREDLIAQYEEDDELDEG